MVSTALTGIAQGRMKSPRRAETSRRTDRKSRLDYVDGGYGKPKSRGARGSVQRETFPSVLGRIEDRDVE
jgi:hypothetical protein